MNDCTRWLACLGWVAVLGCATAREVGDGGVPMLLLSGVRQLTFEGHRAGEGYFSPDGTKIVFQSEREPGNPFYQIYLLDLESGETRRVSPGVGKTTCAWMHPSGRTVLFASTHLDPKAREKQELEVAARSSAGSRRYAWDFDDEYDLFSINLESGGPRRLTRARGYDAEASYSPDGTRIVFTSNRHAFEDGLSPEDRALFARDPSTMAEIYRMDADGSNVRRLTRTPGYDGGAFFSPDGSRIVWRRFSEDGERAEIYSMDLEGEVVRRLTSLGAMSWAPFFHPSGEYVIFTTNLHGSENFELYLVDAEGRREPVRVTESEGFDGLPAFSPDGIQLAWTRGRTSSGKPQIFTAGWNHDAARARLTVGPPRSRQRAVTDGAQGRRPREAKGGSSISVDDLSRHVEALASEAMQGRRAGSDGGRLATAYVAEAFARWGLDPAGDDGTYFQRFEFTSGVSLDAGNELRVDGPGSFRDYAVGSDWRPLAFSRTGRSGAARVAFVGYGIVAPAMDRFDAYDAYAGLDVAGHWVLALRYLPEHLAPERRQHLNRYASLRYKAMVARDRGAIGLILVSGPDAKVKDPLVPLRLDASVGATSLLSISVTDTLAAELLAPSGHTLGALQSDLDGGEPQPGFVIPNLTFDANVALVQEKREARNVLARLRASSFGQAPPLVIGAHVDHLGRGTGGASLARESERGQVHTGADDNASGVAAVLEIAESLAAAVREERIALARDVIFATWSGEEIGLLGSAAFARGFAEGDHGTARAVAAYINLDMIGRLRDRMLLYGVGSSSIWPSAIERSNAPIGLPIVAREDSALPTDATSFHLKGIPTLTMFTGVHPEYHTPRDRPETLSYAGLVRITRFVEALGRVVAENHEVPDFLASAEPQRLGERAGLRATLGTIPSYSEGDVSGLPISGVTRGGPAESAGLRGGDRVVEVAGGRIENIYDYTYAIDALVVGEPVGIVVSRDGERLSFEITPASRE